jgi:hypothetical protein
MKLKKSDSMKLVRIAVFTFAILGLTACNGTLEKSDTAFGVEDLPKWVRTMVTDDDWEKIFNSKTPEELELFFMEGLGSMDERPTTPEGSQEQIVLPGQEQTGPGYHMMTEDGLVDVDPEDLDDYLKKSFENNANN